MSVCGNHFYTKRFCDYCQENVTQFLSFFFCFLNDANQIIEQSLMLIRSKSDIIVLAAVRRHSS